MFINFKALLSFLWVLFLVQNLQAASGDYISLSKPVENWEEVFESSGVDSYYKVQKGDTLYDISRLLFGDPHFWPKIWSLNAVITNPHLIEINDYIYFSDGTSSQPPRVGISKIRPANYQYGKGFLTPVVPPENPFAKSPPIGLPTSLPQVYVNAGQDPVKRESVKSIETGKRFSESVKPSFLVTTEIVETLPEKTGKVTSVDSGALSSIKGNFLRVRVKDSTVQLGDRFSVYSLIKTQKAYPNLIRWEGEISLFSKARGYKNRYYAKVEKAYSVFTKGSFLSKQKIKRADIKDGDTEGKYTVKAFKILGADGVFGRKVIRLGEVVYINKGLKDSVQPGQIYPIYSVSNTLFSYNTQTIPLKSGRLKIVSADRNYATALMSEVSGRISSGDGYKRD